MSRKYKFNNPTAAYFVSFATVYWIYVFTRQTYFNVLEYSFVENNIKTKNLLK